MPHAWNGKLHWWINNLNYQSMGKKMRCKITTSSCQLRGGMPLKNGLWRRCCKNKLQSTEKNSSWLQTTSEFPRRRSTLLLQRTEECFVGEIKSLKRNPLGDRSLSSSNGSFTGERRPHREQHFHHETCMGNNLTCSLHCCSYPTENNDPHFNWR